MYHLMSLDKCPKLCTQHPNADLSISTLDSFYTCSHHPMGSFIIIPTQLLHFTCPGTSFKCEVRSCRWQHQQLICFYCLAVSL